MNATNMKYNIQTKCMYSQRYRNGVLYSIPGDKQSMHDLNHRENHVSLFSNLYLYQITAIQNSVVHDRITK